MRRAAPSTAMAMSPGRDTSCEAKDKWTFVLDRTIAAESGRTPRRAILAHEGENAANRAREYIPTANGVVCKKDKLAFHLQKRRHTTGGL